MRDLASVKANCYLQGIRPTADEQYPVHLQQQILYEVLPHGVSDASWLPRLLHRSHRFPFWTTGGVHFQSACGDRGVMDFL